MNLYQVTAENTNAINEVLCLEDVPQDAIKDTVEGLSGEIALKQKDVAAYMLNLESSIDEMERYKKNMETRIHIEKNKHERLKKMLLWSVMANDKKPVKTAEFTVSVRKNPAKVIVNSEDLIDARYYRVKRELDKTKIKQDLKDGIDVPGVHLEQSESLTIKTN